MLMIPSQTKCLSLWFVMCLLFLQTIIFNWLISFLFTIHDSSALSPAWYLHGIAVRSSGLCCGAAGFKSVLLWALFLSSEDPLGWGSSYWVKFYEWHFRLLASHSIQGISIWRTFSTKLIFFLGILLETSSERSSQWARVECPLWK
jgi:hypothetical protein